MIDCYVVVSVMRIVYDCMYCLCKIRCIRNVVIMNICHYVIIIIIIIKHSLYSTIPHKNVWAQRAYVHKKLC